jgi:hypothetical protein
MDDHPCDDWPSLETIRDGGGGGGMIKSTLMSYLYIASLVIISLCCIVLTIIVWVDSLDLTLRQAIVTGLAIIALIVIWLPLMA